jgi:hypothetical protein
MQGEDGCPTWPKLRRVYKGFIPDSAAASKTDRGMARNKGRGGPSKGQAKRVIMGIGALAEAPGCGFRARLNMPRARVT